MEVEVSGGPKGGGGAGLGANPREGDKNLLFGKIFAENCMRTKEI